MRNRGRERETRERANWTLGSAGEVVYVTPEARTQGGPACGSLPARAASRSPVTTPCNISTKVPDDPDAVAENRAGYATQCTDESRHWVRQVAGDGVERVSRAGLAGRPTRW
jgi:hypothetical protein